MAEFTIPAEWRKGGSVLVCGGRDFTDRQKVKEVLDSLEPGIVVEGGATGADGIAHAWARLNGVHVASVSALWDHYRKPAGPIRNAAMLLLKPDLVVAFPGGRGTADMVRKARAVGIQVLEIPE